ncbi:hypothetical protein ACLOJK_034558 [Asimina triloba]
MMPRPSPISPTIFISLAIFSLLPIIFLPCSVLSSESEDCFPRLVRLAPCAPFIRGSTTSPTTSCCDNLNAIYMEKPACLCALLNGSTNFPINQTLALELPHLCNLQPTTSACPGLLYVPPSPSPSEALALHDPKTNSSTAVPPSVVLPPAVASTFHQSSGTKLKAVQSAGGRESLMIMAAAAGPLLLL